MGYQKKKTEQYMKVKNAEIASRKTGTVVDKVWVGGGRQDGAGTALSGAAGNESNGERDRAGVYF